MRKIMLGLLFPLFCGYNSSAQIGNGGIPLSLQSQNNDQYIPTHSFSLPDWEREVAVEEKNTPPGAPKPYLIGKFIPSDLSFPNSGSFTNNNGNKIWRMQVSIEQAPAIGFYFDHFKLPKGVRLFLSNSNQQQILGAYTVNNNNDDGLFSCEAVQGGLINIELNIDQDVNLNDIQLHIDRVLVYFRSISYLAQYASEKNTEARPTDGSADPYDFEGRSSTCGINAICPDGINYPKQRKATVQTITPMGNNFVGLCSATMVNNTGNSATACKQYILSATHCEGSNSVSGTAFSQMLVRFNFEKTQCQGGPIATVNTMTGVTFRARANYIETVNPQINGDFLLVELNQKVPSSWDAYLAGWNKATSIPTTTTLPKRFIGFHHPSGDVKKVSTGQSISPNGQAGGSEGPGTHYEMMVETGGIEQGSSGSALFDGDGRIIGIASVAGYDIPSCSINGQGNSAMFMKYVAYSKFNYDWDYSLDGSDNSRKLKPWLDPANTGAITTNPIKSDCSDLGTTSININNNRLDQSISIYPNPITNGTVNARINLENAADLIVEIYDISGKLQSTYNLKNVKSGAYTFDMKSLSNGMYLLKFNDGNSITTKKVMLAH